MKDTSQGSKGAHRGGPPYILQWLLFYHHNLHEFHILDYDKSESEVLLSKMNAL